MTMAADKRGPVPDNHITGLAPQGNQAEDTA